MASRKAHYHFIPTASAEYFFHQIQIPSRSLSRGRKEKKQSDLEMDNLICIYFECRCGIMKPNECDRVSGLLYFIMIRLLDDMFPAEERAAALP